MGNTVYTDVSLKEGNEEVNKWFTELLEKMLIPESERTARTGNYKPVINLIKKWRAIEDFPGGWSNIDNIGCSRCYITGTEGHTIFFESNGCHPEQLIEALAEEAQGYDSSVVFEYVYEDELGEDRGGAAVRKRDL
tara:strand:- start:159 stop:566 length:408 start_codon:yes stop_codon:yes gene_type:complete